MRKLLFFMGVLMLLNIAAAEITECVIGEDITNKLDCEEYKTESWCQDDYDNTKYGKMGYDSGFLVDNGVNWCYWSGDKGSCKRGGTEVESGLSITPCEDRSIADCKTRPYYIPESVAGAGNEQAFKCEEKSGKDYWVGRTSYTTYSWEECYNDATCKETYMCERDGECIGSCAYDNLFHSGWGVCARPLGAITSYKSNYTRSIKQPQYCREENVLGETTAGHVDSIDVKRYFYAENPDEFYGISHYDIFAADASQTEATLTGYYTDKMYGACDRSSSNDDGCGVLGKDNTMVSENYELTGCNLESPDSYMDLCGETIVGDKCLALRWDAYFDPSGIYLQKCDTNFADDCSDDFCISGTCAEGCVLKDNFVAQGPFLKTVPYGPKDFWHKYGTELTTGDSDDTYSTSFYMFMYDGSETDGSDDLFITKPTRYTTSMDSPGDYCVYTSECNYKSGWNSAYTNELKNLGQTECVCINGYCNSGKYCADTTFSAPRGVIYDLSLVGDSCTPDNSGWDGVKVDAVIKGVKFADDEGNFCKIDNCRKKERSESIVSNDIVTDWLYDYVFFDVGIDAFYVTGEDFYEDYGEITNRCYWKLNSAKTVPDSDSTPLSEADRLSECIDSMASDNNIYLGLLPLPYDSRLSNNAYQTHCPEGWSHNANFGCVLGDHNIQGWTILDLGEAKLIDKMQIIAKASDTFGGDKSELVIYASTDIESWGSPILIEAIDTTSEVVITENSDVNARYILLTASHRSFERLSDNVKPDADVWIDEFKYKTKRDSGDLELADEFICDYSDSDNSLDDGIETDFYTRNDCPVYLNSDLMRMTVTIENTGDAVLQEPGVLIWFGDMEDDGPINNNLNCDTAPDNPWCFFGRKFSAVFPHSAMNSRSGKFAAYWFPALENEGTDFMPEYQCERVYESGTWDNVLSIGEEIRVTCWVSKDQYDADYHIYLFDKERDVGASGSGPVIQYSSTGPTLHRAINYTDRFAEMHSLGNNYGKIENSNSDLGAVNSILYPNMRFYWNEKNIRNIAFRYSQETAYYNYEPLFDMRDNCWTQVADYYECSDEGIIAKTFSGIRPATYLIQWVGSGRGRMSFDGIQWFTISSAGSTDFEPRNPIEGPLFVDIPDSGDITIYFDDNSEDEDLQIQRLDFTYTWVNMQGNVANSFDDLNGDVIDYAESSTRLRIAQITECTDCIFCQPMDASDEFVHRWLYKNKPVNPNTLTDYQHLPENWDYSKSALLVYVNRAINTNENSPNALYLDLDIDRYFLADLKVHGISERGDELVYGVNYMEDDETRDANRIYYANNSEDSGSSRNCESSGFSYEEVYGDSCSAENLWPAIEYATSDSSVTQSSDDTGDWTDENSHYSCSDAESCKADFVWTGIASGDYIVKWTGAVDTTNQNTGNGEITIGAQTKSFTKKSYGTHTLFDTVTIADNGILTVTVHDKSADYSISECIGFDCETLKSVSCSSPSVCGDSPIYCNCTTEEVAGSDMQFGGIVLIDYLTGTVAYQLDGLQADEVIFNKGWYAVEFTKISDKRNNLTETDASFRYTGVDASDNPYNFSSTEADSSMSPISSLFSDDADTIGNIEPYDRFDIPLYLPDVYEGYDIGCFVSDKYTSSFAEIFYRAFIYKLKFDVIFNMMVEEFSDYTVPIKIQLKDEPDENWDQPTSRLSAANSIGKIRETNPNIDDTTGCISKDVLLDDNPNKIGYSVISVSDGAEYSLRLIDNTGEECFGTGRKDAAETSTDFGSSCTAESTIEICVYGDQAEIEIDYVELQNNDITLHKDDFEGKTVVDRVIAENCPNDYCDITLGETAMTCSDCYNICEENGYQPATYKCPPNMEITKDAPGCFTIGDIGDKCTNSCHCNDITYTSIEGSSTADPGRCNARERCAPLLYSSDVLNEVSQLDNCPVPSGYDCSNYGRKYVSDSETVYECLNPATNKTKEICRVSA